MSGDVPADILELKQGLDQVTLPPELRDKASQIIERLTRSYEHGSYFEEYERVSHYLKWIAKLPWDKESEDNLDLPSARKVLDAHHFGLEDVKERLLEYLAVLKLNQDQGKTDLARAPMLLLVGLVGTGKTTFAYSLAEALGRKIERIPFGGMGSAKDLRGQSRLHLEAEPGYVMKAMVRAQTNNPIILLDEIDRVSEQARADVMGVLVELLDPEQNMAFTDHYIDYPFNLSQVIFIATANATSHLATAVMDRLEPISMPSYTDQEKLMIGKNYLLPRALKEAALPEGVLVIDESVWPQVVRPLGYDAGIRSLQRTIQGIVRKTAREYVEGKITQLTLNQANLEQYLPSYKTELI